VKTASQTLHYPTPEKIGNKTGMRTLHRESKRQLSSHVVCHFTDGDFAVRVAELKKIPEVGA
jgi:hypothetical protein